MTDKCKNCKKNYKVLTKEGLCAYCFQDEHKSWSSDFSSSDKTQEIPMKFSKVKARNKRKKKKKK